MNYDRRHALILCLALALILTACHRTSDRQKEGNREDAASGQAAETPVASVFAYGIVEARQHSTLSAKFPGKLEEILVREGQAVREGQLLGRFEASELDAQLEAARAAVRVAEAELNDAMAGFRPQEVKRAEQRLSEAGARLEKARLDWERAEALLKRELIAEADWEAARLALASSVAANNIASEELSLLREGTRKETIDTLKRRLDLAREQVRLAEAALENARLTAPYDGVITRKHREEGEAMDIGFPVMDIATLDDRYVRTEIDETDIGKIKLGQKTVVTADGFPGLSFPGQVIDIKKQMGPKRLIPTDPSKMVDFKVLDVEVSLPKECPFCIKLPVNVRIIIEDEG
jgi:multidrug resistance efflux pump